LADLASAISEAPEAEENQDGDDAEGSAEDTSSTTSPPPALSEETCIDKKRKCEELVSSSTSAQRTVADEAPVQEEDDELFDLWHRKFSSSSMISLCLLCSFWVVKSFFPFAFSDDEEPKRDAPSAPPTEDVVAKDPLVQETEPTVKSPKVTRASVKKVPVTRSIKRSRKSKDTDVSLEAHESADSPDDVSKCP
jgi:hypothetical protein